MMKSDSSVDYNARSYVLEDTKSHMKGDSLPSDLLSISHDSSSFAEPKPSSEFDSTAFVSTMVETVKDLMESMMVERTDAFFALDTDGKQWEESASMMDEIKNLEGSATDDLRDQLLKANRLLLQNQLEDASTVRKDRHDQETDGQSLPVFEVDVSGRKGLTTVQEVPRTPRRILHKRSTFEIEEPPRKAQSQRRSIFPEIPSCPSWKDCAPSTKG